jgi:hypothetical protein
MRSQLGTLAILLLALGALGCGDSADHDSSSTAARASKVVPTNFTTHNNDRDNDGDHNDDDEGVLRYGSAASPVDQRLSTALVTAYFKMAAAENGVKACSLLAPFIAESVAEDYASTPLRGKDCAAVMRRLFHEHHALLATKNATLRVIEVRVEGDKALAILAFPTIPEVRQITERRVGNGWKLIDLLDGILE